MSIKNSSDLTNGNNAILALINPSSISPSILCSQLQDMIDSLWNKIDSTFTSPPISMLKADLATSIGLSTLKDKQWIKITDRADGNPLFVQANLTNKISPFGIWVKLGVPLFVVMDYTNGYNGESNPFLLVIDENRKFILNGSSGIEKIISHTENLDFGSGGAVAAQSKFDITFTLTGAQLGDTVLLGIPSIPAAACTYFAFIPSADNCTIRFSNGSASGQTPVAGDFNIKIIR